MNKDTTDISPCMTPKRLLKKIPVKEIQEDYKIKKESLDVIQKSKAETGSCINLLKRKKNIGKKISMAGLAIILCPEPFLDVIGIPLFITGGVLQRVYSSISISDISEEARSVMNQLKDLAT